MSAIMGCLSRREPIMPEDMDLAGAYLTKYKWDRIHTWSDAHVFLAVICSG